MSHFKDLPTFLGRLRNNSGTVLMYKFLGFVRAENQQKLHPYLFSLSLYLSHMRACAHTDTS